MADAVPDMRVDFTSYGEGQGSLQQVMVGLGSPTIVIRPRFEEDENLIVLEVEAGHPANEVAAVLFEIATAMDATVLEDQPKVIDGEVVAE